ncbi:serine/threonine protein kinase [Domibacillus robiginosus]|uniref:serine/threonine protein kinase n=1 Tax=Domibacillus robiginosus TaxID=1071054 RepID=UPI00067E5C5B|nr:protein kinase [Domibacillus robiginosus]
MKKIFSRFIERPLKPGVLAGGRFQLISLLGRGSYGLTYKAKDLSTGRDVVVKQLRNRKRHKPDEIRFFWQEARFLKQFHHPSIPQFIAAFQQKGIPFFVMDFVDAPNFEELIFHQHHVYNEKDSFRILLNVIHVVQYFHRLGIVHRDLRIPNILWDGSSVYVIDFGLARRLGSKSSSRRRKTEHPLFRELSVKSDFFALGHFVLFLLYSTFEPSSKREKSWEEELTLSLPARRVIRRLLQIDRPYQTTDELLTDVQLVIDAPEAGCL